MKPQNLACPDCGGPMVPRSSAHGKFWGCSNYPNCRGTRNVMGEAKTRRETEADTLPSQRWAGRDRRRWDQ